MKTPRYMSGKSIDAVGIIPARWGSSRFPGKPLAMIGDRTMIERVWRRAMKALSRVIIATDDTRIAGEARRFGAEAVMTSPDCPNGTARVLEAYLKAGHGEEIVVDIQGDEPFVDPEVITGTAGLLAGHDSIGIATSATLYSGDYDGLADPNRVKVTVDRLGRAITFSRSVIPYIRDAGHEKWPQLYPYLIHTGLYAFRADRLAGLVEMPPSPLEQCERLEQMRWLGNGEEILVHISRGEHLPSVDTPADIDKAVAALGSVGEID